MQDAADLSRLFELFEAALEQAEEQRAPFLERECAGDAVLLGDALELLAQHARTDGVLERAPTLGAAPPEQAAEAMLGTEIGPYRIEAVLGEGGMGVVYRAEQREPLRRQVALKRLKLGMDSESVLRRFDVERQALALMDHPGIARIYDAGATGDGRPYFVMELFEGEPITSFCDEGALPIRARLELLLQVCDAVQHAHRRGIIHRDIKPSNVLVRASDGRLLPKVIDFGIAKATDSGGVPATLTAQGLLVGTPDYMSPEQIATPADVDTRTDVYALGTLLYELLVGALPFDAEAAGPGGLQRRHSEDPLTPSTRVRRLGAAAAALAARRGGDPAQLRKLLRGELDWIAMKAIARERDQRYGSVAELADDLERHLDDRPVAAGPPSAGYRARKFVRRHRPAVAAAAVATAALVAGVSGVVWSGLAARRAQAETQLALEQARREAETTRAVSDLLFETLAAADPELSYASPAEARELKVVDVLAHAGEQAQVRFAARPLLEAQLGALVGQTLLRLGQHDAAEAQLRRALELRERELGAAAAPTLEVRHDLALLAGERGQRDQAERLLRELLATRRRVLGDDHLDTLVSINALAGVLSELGRYPEAATLFEEARERASRTLGAEHMQASEALNGLAFLASRRGEPEAAAGLYAQAFELRRRTAGEDHPATLTALNNLAAARLAAGDAEAAEALYRDIVARYQLVLGPRSPHTLNATSNLGAVLWRLGRLDEAAALYREVVDANLEVLGADHPRTLISANNLGRMLIDQGRLREARSIYLDLIPRAERELPEDHVNLALFHGSYGLLLLRTQRYPEAEAEIQAALRGLEASVGAAHPRVRTQLERLVELYEAWGKAERAESYRARLAAAS